MQEGEKVLPLWLPSQALCASSPPGRAKCTPVGGGKVSGKANYVFNSQFYISLARM